MLTFVICYSCIVALLDKEDVAKMQNASNDGENVVLGLM